MYVYRSICWAFTLISFLKNDFQRWRKTYCMRTQILSFPSKPKRWYLSIFPSSLDTLTPSSRHAAMQVLAPSLRLDGLLLFFFSGYQKHSYPSRPCWKISFSMDTGPATTSLPRTLRVLRANVSKLHGKVLKSNICMILYLKWGYMCVCPPETGGTTS